MKNRKSGKSSSTSSGKPVSYWKSIGWNGTNWKEVYTKLGAVVHDGPINKLMNDHTLLVTNCSKTKGTVGDKAIPEDFYKGVTPQLLINFGKRNKLNWAIMSDLYGIYYPEEKLAFYDIGPDQVKEPKELGKLIGSRALERKYTRVIYYCSSPLRARPYIRFLSHSGLKFVYVKKLRFESRKGGFGIK